MVRSCVQCGHHYQLRDHGCRVTFRGHRTPRPEFANRAHGLRELLHRLLSFRDHIALPGLRPRGVLPQYDGAAHQLLGLGPRGHHRADSHLDHPLLLLDHRLRGEQGHQHLQRVAGNPAHSTCARLPQRVRLSRGLDVDPWCGGLEPNVVLDCRCDLLRHIRFCHPRLVDYCCASGGSEGWHDGRRGAQQTRRPSLGFWGHRQDDVYIGPGHVGRFLPRLYSGAYPFLALYLAVLLCLHRPRLCGADESGDCDHCGERDGNFAERSRATVAGQTRKACGGDEAVESALYLDGPGRERHSELVGVQVVVQGQGDEEQVEVARLPARGLPGALPAPGRRRRRDQRQRVFRGPQPHEGRCSVQGRVPTSEDARQAPGFRHATNRE
mmetsp:Transcript_8765/g.31230  ORF Transcript_8765/g.31230 Transcript_8765/m.31230 type:complete len:382 (+) Transcript_8765:658-1803(+)